MQTGGLKRIHIVIIGAVLGILIAAGVFFAAIKPKQDVMAEVVAEEEGYEQKAATRSSVEKKLASAKQQQATSRIKLLAYESRYMRLGPERAFLSVKDRQKAMILLWKEQANTMGPLLRNFIRRSGVRLVTPIQVPGAPVDPNQINVNEYTVPLGQIQVVGRFDQINNFLRSIRNAPRLLRVNNVTLEGTSPNITGTIDLTMIVLPRDSEAATEPVPLATGEGAVDGGGATPGGYPTGTGGYPGYQGPAGGTAGGANGG